jgi:hypothetical protein
MPFGVKSQESVVHNHYEWHQLRGFAEKRKKQEGVKDTTVERHHCEKRGGSRIAGKM